MQQILKEIVQLFVYSFLKYTHSVCVQLSCKIFFRSTFSAWIGKFSLVFSAFRDVLTDVFGTFGESLKGRGQGQNPCATER